MSKIEIQINEADSRESYGDDIFELSVEDFVEDKYEEKKREMEEALKNQDIDKIKCATHTLKTSSRYIGEENFANECNKMESMASKGDWAGICQNFEYYLEYFEELYYAVYQIYLRIQSQSNKNIVAALPRERTKGEMPFTKPEEISPKKADSVVSKKQSKKQEITFGFSDSDKSDADEETNRLKDLKLDEVPQESKCFTFYFVPRLFIPFRSH